MERMQTLTGIPIPPALAALRTKPERHTGVIAKEKMLEFVLGR